MSEALLPSTVTYSFPNLFSYERSHQQFENVVLFYGIKLTPDRTLRRQLFSSAFLKAMARSPSKVLGVLGENEGDLCFYVLDEKHDDLGGTLVLLKKDNDGTLSFDLKHHQTAARTHPERRNR